MTVALTFSFDDVLSKRLQERGIDMLDTNAIREYVFSLIYTDLEGAKK